MRFELSDASAVRDVYQHTRPGNLIGFYQVRRDMHGETSVYPLRMEDIRPY